MVIDFRLYGKWDELDDIDTARKLLDDLKEMGLGSSYMVKDLSLGIDAPGNLADDQGNPFEHFAEFKRLYVPLGLTGVYTICGIDTAANSYPARDEVSLDKQGQPGTVVITPDMTPFNIMQAVVAWADSKFDDYPHHAWFEWLRIDTDTQRLMFDMGS